MLIGGVGFCKNERKGGIGTSRVRVGPDRFFDARRRMMLRGGVRRSE